MKTVLVIEDDPAILEGLIASLEAEHYTVVPVTNGEEGYRRALEGGIDLILLDLMLPGMNGETVCRELRAQGIPTPIIMLTSKSGEIDTVLGLEIGADDYVTKPFSTRELLARIAAVLRRHPDMPRTVERYAFGDVTLDFKKQEATKAGEVIRLSSKEFDILHYFAQHEGEVISRDMLLDNVWGYEHFPTTRTVDNYILSIRKKIETDPSKPGHLVTVHTAGYKFVK